MENNGILKLNSFFKHNDLVNEFNCHNHNLRFVTKAKRGLQGCGPRGSLGVTPHAPKSVGKCEGMNPHTPKATPTLRNGKKWSLSGLPNFQKVIVGVKT
jgi:hypothetical protein